MHAGSIYGGASSSGGLDRHGAKLCVRQGGMASLMADSTVRTIHGYHSSALIESIQSRW